MKKYIYSLALAFTCFTTAVFSQNIQIIDSNGYVVKNNDTIIVNGIASDPLLSVHYWVANESAGTMTIKMREDTTPTLVSGASFFFCWTKCYAPFVRLSPTGIPLTTQDTNKPNFHGDYQPNSNPGTTIIRYSFFDQANPNDSAWILVKFIVAPLSVQQLAANAIHISAPSPNPANGITKFTYKLSGTQQGSLKVYNTIGQCVETVNVNAANDKLNVNVSSLPSGIYICKFEANGSEPVYQRLVVSH